MAPLEEYDDEYFDDDRGPTRGRGGERFADDRYDRYPERRDYADDDDYAPGYPRLRRSRLPVPGA